MQKLEINKKNAVVEEGCNKCLGKMLGIGLERKGKSQKMLHYRAGEVLEIGIRGNKGM